MREVMKKIKQKISYILTAITITIPLTISASAEDIKGSKLATGTEKLISDATAWLMIIAPTVGILVMIYCFIRKGASEELDHKKWNTRIIVAIVSSLGALLAAVIVNLLINYYQ
jgi:hypothetical protein